MGNFEREWTAERMPDEQYGGCAGGLFNRGHDDARHLADIREWGGMPIESDGLQPIDRPRTGEPADQWLEGHHVSASTREEE